VTNRHSKKYGTVKNTAPVSVWQGFKNHERVEINHTMHHFPKIRLKPYKMNGPTFRIPEGMHMPNNLKWSGKLDNLRERVEALERINVLRGHAKGNTRQARAIAFIVENMEALQELVEKSNGHHPATSNGQLPKGD
jgi:hypothetical protein